MAADGKLGGTEWYLESEGHYGGENTCRWRMDTAIGKTLSSHDMRVQYGGQAILHTQGQDVYVGVGEKEVYGMEGCRWGVKSSIRIEQDALEFGTVDAKVIWMIENGIGFTFMLAFAGGVDSLGLREKPCSDALGCEFATQ